jgi:hypothetical protein
MSNNQNFHKARRDKKDEFYTQMGDIENELRHYRPQLRGKVIFCNCDDPTESNFWKFFFLNFEFLGLKKLIATHYDPEKPTYKLEYDGKEITNTPLNQNGDFRSPECIELLRESDIVITNPPFSLFREYMAQLMEYEKKFLIIGSIGAITYKEFFPLLKENKVWMGYSIHSGDREFGVPKDYPLNASGHRVDEQGRKFLRVKGVRWYTNLDHTQRHEKLILYKKYNEKEYPKYDNYEAINVDKTKEIPMDYKGVMGVPITFLDKYNPEQFEILGDSRYHDGQEFADDINVIQGKETYRRILIKRKGID